MANLQLKNICKEYPNTGKKKHDPSAPDTVLAVENFNMEIRDGEFIVFVGPSGCGKSTTLRMIAGLEEITHGELFIDDLIVNNIPPKDRNISMVFQNYALYPHMTVYQNICFPLNYAHFNHPVKAREQEIKNANREIEYGQKLLTFLEKKGEGYKGHNTKEVKAKIEHNIFVREESKQLLEKAIKELESLAPSPEEMKEGKLMDRIRPQGYKDNPIWQKYRHYYEATRTHYSKQDKDDIIREVSRLVDITKYLDRKPKALSGGQRQRVALARALVRSPKVFLLDEPLSNLDAKLRTQMRSEIVSLHQKIGTTFIYVTHDQVEAMTMGDRIVVMAMGKVQQIDTPSNLFDYPKNKFVAGFIGTPQMNFFDVKIRKNKDELAFLFSNKEQLLFPLKGMRKLKSEYLDGKEHEATLGIRSEDLSLSEKGLTGKVAGVEILGNETHLFIERPDQEKNIILKSYSRPQIRIGNTIEFFFNASKIHLFSKNDDEMSILEDK